MVSFFPCTSLIVIPRDSRSGASGGARVPVPARRAAGGLHVPARGETGLVRVAPRLRGAHVLLHSRLRESSIGM